MSYLRFDVRIRASIEDDT